MAEALKNRIRAKLIELYTRRINYDKKLDVYLNGDDNQYPLEMERVISNSPTASRAANIMSKYIAGSGVSDDEVINPKTQLKKSGLVKAISNDVSTQYGCWIHVGYAIDAEGKLAPANPKVLDYVKCRTGKKDDEENEGKIYYDDYSSDKKQRLNKSRKQKVKWFYPFNKNQKVIITQIKADAKISNKKGGSLEDMLPHYRGQVYYLNLTPQFIYAVSPFDSVYNDCDTEYRMGLYSNNVTRTGFLGKIAVITQGLDDEDEKTVDNDVKNWLGAEESGNVWRLNVPETDDLAQVVRIEQIKSQYDEKQFTETRKNARMNILGAANNIPESLVFNSGGLFAQSGEAYKQLKLFYAEQTDYERSKVEETMGILGFPCNITPLISEDIEEAQEPGEGNGSEPKPDDETRSAQAALRGSVGGVQGILNIQSSVSSETTDFESAIAILVEIYGFTRTIASKLLGRPEIETE